MLVLSRHRDESIMIGDDVVITIVDIRGDKVRLGIDAPQDIPVHRREVYEAIQRENQKAAEIKAQDAENYKNQGTTKPDQKKSNIETKVEAPSESKDSKLSGKLRPPEKPGLRIVHATEYSISGDLDAYDINRNYGEVITVTNYSR